MKKILIVEDDPVFISSLARTLQRRGYVCVMADTVGEALRLCSEHRFDSIFLDLNLKNETTQNHVSEFRKKMPDSSLVILTGFGTIPSAVQAVKDGATSYLSKPATPEAIFKALEEKPKSSKLPLWELEQSHILKIMDDCKGNVSEASRRLGLHRRTLQRRLKKT